MTGITISTTFSCALVKHARKLVRKAGIDSVHNE